MGIVQKVAALFSPVPDPEIEAKGRPLVTGWPRATADFWPHTADLPLDSGDGLVKVRLASYVLYSILRYRASKLTEARPYIGQEDGNGNFEWVPHELDPLLKRPNPDEDWTELAETTQMLIDLDGRALWVKHRDNAGRVRSLRVYNEGEFEVQQSWDETGMGRLYGSFRVQGDGWSRVYGAEDVVFFRTPHPYDRYETLSPTDAVLGMLGIAGELQTRVKGMVRNAAVMGGAFTRPADAPPLHGDELQAELQHIRTQYQGMMSGRPGLLQGGMTYTKTGMSLSEVKFGELWREVEAAACAAFGIRPEILGFLVGLENSPWSHMETARRLAIEDSAMPVWRRWTSTLDRWLLEPADADRGLSVQFDTSAISVLKEDHSKGAEIVARAGRDMTRNERRQLLGLEPTDNPADDEIEREAPMRLPALAGMSNPLKLEAKSDRPEWKAFDELATKQEQALEPILTELLMGDRAAAYRTWQQISGAKDADMARRITRYMEEMERIFKEARYEQWNENLGPIFTRAAQEAAQGIAQGLGISFDLVTPGAVEWARNHVGELIEDLHATTLDALRSHMASALDLGESIDQMADRINNAGAFGESRSRLIARTESTTVVNRAQLNGVQAWAEDEGLTVWKTWLATNDDRTRDEHLAVNGERVRVGERFSLGLDAPSEPNCRCTLTYEVER